MAKITAQDQGRGCAAAGMDPKDGLKKTRISDLSKVTHEAEHRRICGRFEKRKIYVISSMLRSYFLFFYDVPLDVPFRDHVV